MNVGDNQTPTSSPNVGLAPFDLTTSLTKGLPSQAREEPTLHCCL